VRTIVAPEAVEKTKILKIAFSTVEKFRDGAIVAIAVENSYVALVDPTSEIGLGEFRSIKENAADIFYPLFVNSVEDLIGFVNSISSTEKLLASSFWPGLLNIEFKANVHLPHNLGAINPPLTLIARKPKNPLLNAITELMGPLIYTTLLDKSNKPVKNLSELTPRVKKIITLGINSGDIKSHRKTTLISCAGEIPFLAKEGSIPSWKVKKIISDLRVN
jgi:tRNA A37 threonylcarbamoyladenosine synthetase subunit TsaC/SUA5/YrdC